MADDAAPSDFERLEQERDAALLDAERLQRERDALAAIVAQMRNMVQQLVELAPGVFDDYTDDKEPEIAQAVLTFTRMLDSVAGGGGATPGEPPTATVTHGPERGSFAWGPKGWR